MFWAPLSLLYTADTHAGSRLGPSCKTVIAKRTRSCGRGGEEEEEKKTEKKAGKGGVSIINDNVAYVHSLIRGSIAASSMCFTNKFPPAHCR